MGIPSHVLTFSEDSTVKDNNRYNPPPLGFGLVITISLIPPTECHTDPIIHVHSCFIQFNFAGGRGGELAQLVRAWGM